MRGLIALLALVLVFAAPASARFFLSVPDDITVEATSESGAPVTYPTPAGDTCDPASGSTFPLGLTTVTCTGADEGTFTVRVQDTTDPDVSPPGDLPKTVTTGNPAGTSVTYGSASATDIVSGSISAPCAPASGSTFTPGTHTVTCTATDDAGNQGSASSTVTVNLVDGTPPTLTVPSDITVEATGAGGAVVTFGTSASDTIDPSPTVTCSHSSGATFPLGTTNVSCTAKDATGNTSAPKTFNVKVQDTTPPSFTSIPSGTVTRDATSASGASYSFTVSATDAVDSSPAIVCNHNPAGATYALGSTSVSCTATDDAGKSVTAGFVVRVVDSSAPTFTSVPAPITRNATGPSGASATFTISAVDNIDSTPTITCNHASGSIFPIGTTTVSCTAKDDAGNTSAPASFDVHVVDVDAPTISVPGTITRAATGPGGASVTFTVTAADAVDPSPTISCNHPSGSTFPLGTTSVSCTAKDSSNNTSAPRTFNVTVTDTTAPSFTSIPSGTATREAAGPGGAAFSFTVAASDVVDPAPIISCNHSSGETFQLGNTTVSCTAKDHSNNTSPASSFTVNVVDTTKPDLQNIPTNLTVEANGPAGSKVNFATPVGVDLVDGPVTNVSCSPASGSTFALGTRTVNCSASDSRNNTAAASFTVTVADTTPPALVIPVSFGIHATSPEGIPRNDSTISGYLASAFATDIVDPNPRVTNNAPAFLNVGTTDVTFTARDASGNGTSRSSAIVVLPQPPPGTPPRVVPPAPKQPDNPKTLKATPGDGSIKLVWASVAGAKKYLVYRSESGQRRTSAVGHGAVVYTGTATTFTDRGLQNGIEYRYVVVCEDASGNQSAGVAIVVVPRRNLLRSPKDGARLRKPPNLVWAANAEADYFNAQLLRNGKKILSVWPVKPSFLLTKGWKFEGRKYTLVPGLYTWYVWPGFGARAAVDYGDVMGSRTFRIVR